VSHGQCNRSLWPYSQISILEPLLFLAKQLLNCTHEAEWTIFQTQYFSEKSGITRNRIQTSGSVARGSLRRVRRPISFYQDKESKLRIRHVTFKIIRAGLGVKITLSGRITETVRVRVLVGWVISSFPHHLYWFYGSPSILSNEYRGSVHPLSLMQNMASLVQPLSLQPL
jgi:hypothetical protein